MSLIKVASKTTSLTNDISNELKFEWHDKLGKKSNLFECFRELFEKLNDDKIKKFNITIGNNNYNIDKNTFYENYKMLKQKVEKNVNKIYPKLETSSVAETSASKG